MQRIRRCILCHGVTENWWVRLVFKAVNILLPVAILILGVARDEHLRLPTSLWAIVCVHFVLAVVAVVRVEEQRQFADRTSDSGWNIRTSSPPPSSHATQRLSARVAHALLFLVV